MYLHVHVHVSLFISTCALALKDHKNVLFVRLQKEIDNKESDHQESSKALEEKYSVEVQTLQATIATLEANNAETQEEVCTVYTCTITCPLYYVHVCHVHVHVYDYSLFSSEHYMYSRTVNSFKGGTLMNLLYIKCHTEHLSSVPSSQAVTALLLPLIWQLQHCQTQVVGTSTDYSL